MYNVLFAILRMAEEACEEMSEYILWHSMRACVIIVLIRRTRTRNQLPLLFIVFRREFMDLPILILVRLSRFVWY